MSKTPICRHCGREACICHGVTVPPARGEPDPTDALRLLLDAHRRCPDHSEHWPAIAEATERLIGPVAGFGWGKADADALCVALSAGSGRAAGPRQAADIAKAFWFALHPRDVQSEHGWRANAPQWVDAMMSAVAATNATAERVAENNALLAEVEQRIATSYAAAGPRAADPEPLRKALAEIAKLATDTVSGRKLHETVNDLAAIQKLAKVALYTPPSVRAASAPPEPCDCRNCVEARSLCLRRARAGPPEVDSERLIDKHFCSTCGTRLQGRWCGRCRRDVPQVERAAGAGTGGTDG